MTRAHAAQALPGEDVFDDSLDGASGGAVGTVVMAAASPEGGVDLLLECSTALVGAAQLRIGQAQSGHISLGEVPYPMINPTA
jgi:hypothetical protein